MKISWVVYLLVGVVLVFIFVWPGFILGRPIWGQAVVQQQPVATATVQPTATATAQPVPTATPTSVGAGQTDQTLSSGTAKFPTTPAEAAALFGGDVSRWEKNPDGGWHLREEATTTLVNPQGFLGEGYNDTKPGKNPDCYAFTVPIAVQGATLWPEPGTRDNAVKLQAKMAIPVWDDGKQHACRVLAP